MIRSLCIPIYVNPTNRDELLAYIFEIRKNRDKSGGEILPVRKDTYSKKWSKFLIGKLRTDKKKCKEGEILIELEFLMDEILAITQPTETDAENLRKKYSVDINLIKYLWHTLQGSSTKKLYVPQYAYYSTAKEDRQRFFDNLTDSATIEENGQKLEKKRGIFRNIKPFDRINIISQVQEITFKIKCKRLVEPNYLLDFLAFKNNGICLIRTFDFVKYQSNLLIHEKWNEYKKMTKDGLILLFNNEPIMDIPKKIIYYGDSKNMVETPIYIPRIYKIHFKDQKPYRDILHNYPSDVTMEIRQMVENYRTYIKKFMRMECVLQRKLLKIRVKFRKTSTEFHFIDQNIKRLKKAFKDIKISLVEEGNRVEKSVKIEACFDSTRINFDIYGDIILNNPNLDLVIDDTKTSSHSNNMSIHTSTGNKLTGLLVQKLSKKALGKKSVLTFTTEGKNIETLKRFANLIGVSLALYEAQKEGLSSEYQHLLKNFDVISFLDCKKIKCGGRKKCPKTCGKCNPVLNVCTPSLATLPWHVSGYSRDVCPKANLPLIVDSNDVERMKEGGYDVKEYPVGKDTFLSCPQKNKHFLYLKQKSLLPCCRETNNNAKANEQNLLQAKYYNDISQGKLHHDVYIDLKFKKFNKKGYQKLVQMASALNIPIFGIEADKDDNTIFLTDQDKKMNTENYQNLTEMHIPWIPQIGISNPDELIFITKSPPTKNNASAIIARLYTDSDTVSAEKWLKDKNLKIDVPKRLSKITSPDDPNSRIQSTLRGRAALYDSANGSKFNDFLKRYISEIKSNDGATLSQTNVPIKWKKFVRPRNNGDLPQNLKRFLNLFTMDQIKEKKEWKRFGVSLPPDSGQGYKVSFMRCLEYAKTKKVPKTLIYTLRSELFDYYNSLGKGSGEALMRQSFVNFSTPEMNKLLAKNSDSYIDPRRFHALLSEKYKYNIILFRREMESNSAEFTLPYHQLEYVYSPFKETWPTVIIYEHFGSDFKRTSCEIIGYKQEKGVVLAFDSSLGKSLYQYWVKSQKGFINSKRIDAVPKLNLVFFSKQLWTQRINNYGKGDALIYNNMILNTTVTPHFLPSSTIPVGSEFSLPKRKQVHSMIESIGGTTLYENKYSIGWKLNDYIFEVDINSQSSLMELYTNNRMLAKCLVGFCVFSYIQKYLTEEGVKDTAQINTKYLDKFIDTLASQGRVTGSISIKNQLPPPNKIYSDGKLNINNKYFLPDEGKKELLLNKIRFVILQQINSDFNQLGKYITFTSIPTYYKLTSDFNKLQGETIIDSSETIINRPNYTLHMYPLQPDIEETITFYWNNFHMTKNNLFIGKSFIKLNSAIQWLVKNGYKLNQRVDLYDFNAQSPCIINYDTFYVATFKSDSWISFKGATYSDNELGRRQEEADDEGDQIASSESETDSDSEDEDEDDEEDEDDSDSEDNSDPSDSDEEDSDSGEEDSDEEDSDEEESDSEEVKKLRECIQEFGSYFCNVLVQEYERRKATEPDGPLKLELLSKYAKKMSKDKGEYGGNIELQIISKFYESPIQILHKKPPIPYPYIIGEGQKNPTLNIWYNGVNHYDAFNSANKIIKVCGDGDCMFGAIAYALKKRKENPITTSAKTLRREVVQEIKKNPQEYVDFFTWDQESVKPQKPLQKKSLPKGWVIRKSKSAKRNNKIYYYNTITRSSQWDYPNSSKTKKPKVETRIYYTKAWAKNNPKKLIIFGENAKQKGKRIIQKSTQAVVREFPNAIGVRTCYAPGDGFRDRTYKDNTKMIDEDIREILKAYRTEKYSVIVLPEDGLGTGIAQLEKKAPRTHAYLKKALKDAGLSD